MGKAQIIDNLGEGQYTVKLLDDRTKAEQALVRIDAWIAKVDAQIAALPVGDPEHKLPGLKLNRASLVKQKEYILSIPADRTFAAWCADYTLDLTGDVGTIEINGDPDAAINIRPGKIEGAGYNAARDGRTQNIRAMTPEQAFYNMAMMPGWQKWRPTYRIGTITELSGSTCSLTLDAAASKLAANGTGPLHINQANTLSNVPIEYMQCHGAAFKIGDRVIVQFPRNWGDPKVIGFETEPRPCDRNLLVVWAHVHLDYWAYDTDFNPTYRPGTDTIRSGGWNDCVYYYADYFGSLKVPFFVWDMETNDYAADDKKVYWMDPSDPDKIKHYLLKSDYPFMPPIAGDVLAHWTSRTQQATDSIFGYQADNWEHDVRPESGWWNIFENLTGRLIGRVASEVEKAAGLLDIADEPIYLNSTSDMTPKYYTVVGFTGKINTMAETDWEYIIHHDWYDISGTGDIGPKPVWWGFALPPCTGDYRRVWGSYNWLSNTHAVQVHTQRGHERNTICQCEKRDPVTGYWDITKRCSELETAVKSLIAMANVTSTYRHNTEKLYAEPIGGGVRVWDHQGIELIAKYYKGLTTQNGMLAILNEKREQVTDDPLIQSTYCTASSREKVDYFLENAVLRHENPDGSPCDFDGRDGGENLALHPETDTLDEVVDAWMASPRHRAVVMEPLFRYSGYAAGTYPESVDRITLGPGIYNPGTGTYSMTETYYDVPADLRGKLKCYALRMTGTE